MPLLHDNSKKHIDLRETMAKGLTNMTNRNAAKTAILGLIVKLFLISSFGFDYFLKLWLDLL